MGQNNKETIEKSFNPNSIVGHNENNQKISKQHDKIKAKLMKKYNISEDEADKIIHKLELKVRAKKENEESDNSNNVHDNVKFNGELNVDNEGRTKKFEKLSSIKQKDNIDRSTDSTFDGKKDIEDNFDNDSNDVLNSNSSLSIQGQNMSDVNLGQEGSDNQSDVLEDISDKNYTLERGENKQNYNVDSILTDIIPDYNKYVSIEVNHIDLTFDVELDRVDTIKESVIRKLTGNKSDNVKFQALDDVSFKVYKGEKVGIIGYNGAGKSTLLNVICGIYAPDKGSVETHGRISPLLSLGAGFDYNSSGRKNIYLNGAILGYDKDFLESKVDEIIEFSELGDFIDFPIKNYSSGMLSKLGFSIATILDPDILVIDEILSVGDVNYAKKSVDKIRSLMDGGTTVLFVSHSIPQVREICDKAIWIDHGKIREIGEVNKVCDHYLKDAEKATNEQLANIQFR